MARPTVNRFVTTIKQAFKHGSKYGWVDPTIYHALLSVDNLKKGRTKAPEYRDIKPVPEEVSDQPNRECVAHDLHGAFLGEY